MKSIKPLKTFLKIFLGVGVLVLVVVVFSVAMRSSDLENGTLKDWRAAPTDRRVAAAQMITASDSNLDVLVACVDKIASLPDSGEMAIRDALSLCDTGLQLKEHL